MKKYFYILIAALLTAGISNAQTARNFEKAADKAMADKDYYSALEYYQTALDIKPTDIGLIYKVAESARGFNAYKLAEDHYKKVLESPEAINYPEARFWLGQMQIFQGNYNDARTNLEAYAHDEKTTKEMAAKAHLCLGTCEFVAARSVPMQGNAQITKLDETVNSPWNDFGATVLDGKLYFTSMKFESPQDKKVPARSFAGVLWQDKGQLPKRLNIPGTEKALHFAHTTFNHNKDKVYFNICTYLNSSDIRCDLYVSQVMADGWSEPKLLPEPVNMAGYTTTQPYLSYDPASRSERLFFVSDRPGGKGNYDIWYIDIDANGDFGTLMNLESVNTPENEITPFYQASNKALYFSSDGYAGFGGYDVFTSHWTGSKFSTPENIGSPVNGSRNDLYYWLNEKEDTAYFASNRDESTFIVKEKNACCNDIYLTRYIIINLDALTFESATQAPLNACTVKLYEVTPEGRVLVAELTNPQSNLSKFRLNPGRDYWVVASREGYEPDSALVTTKGVGDSKDMTQKLYLKPSTIDLEIFTFDDATKKALENCKVQLFDITDTDKNDILVYENVNPLSNNFTAKIRPCRKYRLIVTRNGYVTHTEEFGTTCDGSQKSMKKDVYLRKATLEDYLPLNVYFENDQPVAKSKSVTTVLEYLTTYNTYYAKKEMYADNYLPQFKSADRAQVEQKVFDFFDNRLKPGKDSLEAFTRILLELLKNGDKIYLELQGYTSPLASLEYNQNLGSRRVNSLINHFRSYDSGVFLPYLKSGQLKLTKRSYGETRASRKVSDSLKDLSASIYSPEASYERRAAIIDVTRAGKMKKKK